MFSEKDLQALLDYSEEGQVLSLYLYTDSSKINPETAQLQLRNLLKSVDLPKDAQVVEDYVNLEYDWTGKGLVIFSNQDAGFFHAYPINLPVPNLIAIRKQPTIRPLAQLLDAFTGWGVVLVDKQGARLFSFNLGELEEVKGFVGDEVKQTKRGGGNAMPGRMGGSGASGKVENTIDKNIKEVMDFTIEFFNKYHIRRIMIGGTEENISLFKDALPKSWQSLVVNVFPMSMTASLPEVLEQATEEALTAQEKHHTSLVDQAITQTAKGSTGVTGLIDTLNTIHDGRVRTLLVSMEFEQEGYRCGGCGYLTTQELEKCPFCGSGFQVIKNAVEMAVQEALTKNADVKIVQGNEVLQKAGHIAAILRY